MQLPNIKLVINYLVKPNRNIFFFLFILVILENFIIFFNILSIVPIGDYFLDTNLKSPNEITKYYIKIYQYLNLEIPIIVFFSIIFIFFIFIKSLWIIVINQTIQIIKFKIHFRLTRKFISAVTTANWNFFLQYPSSSLMQIFANEINKINSLFTNLCLQFANLFKIIAYLGTPIYLNYKITLSFLIMIMILSLPLFFFKNISKQIGRDLIVTQKNFLNNIFEVLSGIKIIIINRIQKKIIENNDYFLKKNIKTALKFNLISNSIQQSYGPIGILSIIISFVYLYKSSTINLNEISQISAILWALYSTFPIFGGIGQIFFETNSLIPSLQNYKKKINKATFVNKNKNLNKKKIFFNKKIIFDKVYFSYPGKEVLDCVSFQLKKNTFNIFYGNSGSGKSTIIELILGILPINKGDILIDNNSYLKVGNENFLDNFGYVGQENFLFNQSIKDNFKMIKKDISNQELDYILKISHCSDFVKKLPKKINYIVGEKGNKLSVGQRQRLCIARALINKPKILILDEITSSLDQKNELGIFKMLEKLKKNTTIIMMTHSKAASRFADNLFKIKNKKIIKIS